MLMCMDCVAHLLSLPACAQSATTLEPKFHEVLPSVAAGKRLCNTAVPSGWQQAIFAVASRFHMSPSDSAEVLSWLPSEMMRTTGVAGSHVQRRYHAVV